MVSAKTEDVILSRSKVRSNERSDKRMCFKEKSQKRKQTKEGKDRYNQKRSKTSNKGRDKRDQESVHNEWFNE